MSEHRCGIEYPKCPGCEERIHALEDAERACKAANESQRQSIRALEIDVEKERSLAEQATHRARKATARIAELERIILRQNTALEKKFGPDCGPDVLFEGGGRESGGNGANKSGPPDPHRPTTAAAKPAAPCPCGYGKPHERVWPHIDPERDWGV